MKFFHISDLHIGKRVCGFSMLEDQRYILEQILELIKEHKPQGILIAGDLYDKSMPSAEAVELADWFLSGLAAMKILVWTISGNHDSAERIAYGGQIMEKAGIHMSRVFDGRPCRYTVFWSGSGVPGVTVHGNDAKEEEREEKEAVDIYLLPFLRPAQVKKFFPEKNIVNTSQAVEAVLEGLPVRKDRTSILVMHQFLAGASVCDSEEISVGGLDQVSVSVTDGFDYVALGHLHGPQRVGRDTVRYCGSPLKYSFSESGQQKSVTVLETGSDCHTVKTDTIPLKPRRDLREIKGPIEELLRPDVVQGADPEDYLHITLTDREKILDAMGRLRDVYPNIMRLDFESRESYEVEEEEIQVEDRSPLELFEEFFLLQNGEAMGEEEKRTARELLDDCFTEKGEKG